LDDAAFVDVLPVEPVAVFAATSVVVFADCFPVRRPVVLFLVSSIPGRWSAFRSGEDAGDGPAASAILLTLVRLATSEAFDLEATL